MRHRFPLSAISPCRDSQNSASIPALVRFVESDREKDLRERGGNPSIRGNTGGFQEGVEELPAVLVETRSADRERLEGHVGSKGNESTDAR